MNKRIKKAIAILSLLLVLSSQSLPTFVNAQEAPTPPTAPSAPTAPEAPATPTSPTAPPAPENTTTPPTAPEAPTLNLGTEPDPSPTPEVQNITQENSPQPSSTPNPTAKKPKTANLPSQPQISITEAAQETTPPAQSPIPLSTTGQQTGDQTANSQNGGASINTGDATNNAGITTFSNDNLSAVVGNSSPGGVSIANTGNGVDSQNNGSATISGETSVTQDNNANILNNLTQSTTTGDNSASRNTGGDSTITTGDANTTGTIITAVNTNVAGVAVSEFNVTDNQTGDIILDFGANCISGCTPSQVALTNEKNGDSSQNNTNLNLSQDNTTFQNNDASVQNNMLLASNSGDNKTNSNTGGNNSITTGDANIAANVLTLANNNIAGNIIYGVVNIFGDLIGDIILPESVLNSLCPTGCANTNFNLANKGNGTGSDNQINLSQVSNDETYQFNNANIDNNLIVSATTGDNEVSRNTTGKNTITTGNSSVDAQVVNIANSNVSGGVWWLVIVNEAGKWVGRIMGSPDGANFAGSAGTEFTMGDNGEIIAVNSGNGADSQNTINSNQTTNNTLVQNNNANIVNNVNLDANTGGNRAIRNTGGNSSITTGDANIVANLVNFVNNNISGSGKLVVTMVNVFGSWMGNFITPGQQKESSPNPEQLAQGAQNPDNDPAKPQGNTDDNKQGGQNNNPTIQTNSTTQTASNSNKTANPVSSALGTATSIMTNNFSQFAGFRIDKNDSNLASHTLIGNNKINKNLIRINLAYLVLIFPLAALAFGIIKVRKKP